MSEKRNDGGPAFPVTPTDRSGQIAETMLGVSVRDYFAAHATEEDVRHWMGVMALNGNPVSREEAKGIYADRMIEERDR